MNISQEKSLCLIDDLLDNMDNDTFLKKYESFEHNIGPTIESFLCENKMQDLWWRGEVFMSCGVCFVNAKTFNAIKLVDLVMKK